MPEIQIYMAEGRSDEVKATLMRDVTAVFVKNLGVPADVVTVQIVEARLADKMKGGKTFLEIKQSK